MKFWGLWFLLFPVTLSAQTDVLILKKYSQNVKTYAPGMSITMETVYNQWLDGTITAIRHDSVFLNSFPFHYKEIKTIRERRHGLNYAFDGAILMVAGGGSLLLGAVNGLYRKDAASQWYSTGGFITAAALLAGGFTLIKLQYRKYNLGKKFTLEYFEINPNKK